MRDGLRKLRHAGTHFVTPSPSLFSPLVPPMPSCFARVLSSRGPSVFLARACRVTARSPPPAERAVPAETQEEYLLLVAAARRDVSSPGIRVTRHSGHEENTEIGDRDSALSRKASATSNNNHLRVIAKPLISNAGGFLREIMKLDHVRPEECKGSVKGARACRCRDTTKNYALHAVHLESFFRSDFRR